MSNTEEFKYMGKTIAEWEAELEKVEGLDEKGNPAWWNIQARLEEAVVWQKMKGEMENIPEIDLKMETQKVGEYNIDDMIQMFGDRIKPAIHENENGGKGLIHVEMRKLFRKWKTNADIKAAYKHYYGYLIAPWVIVNLPSIVMCSPEATKLLKKEISTRYELADGNQKLTNENNKKTKR